MNAVMAPGTDEDMMRERLEPMISAMLGGGRKLWASACRASSSPPRTTRIS